MSRSSINIRQVSIIVCPFSTALIYAISEMWKRQIIWGCWRRWATVFSLTKTPLMYLSEKYGIHHYLYGYFVRDVIIFIITLSQRYYFTGDSNAVIHTQTHRHAHTHIYTHSHTPVSWACCEDTALGRLLFDFHYPTVMMRPPTHANVRATLLSLCLVLPN